MSSYLYLLVEKNNMFKIGKANDIENRYLQLSKEYEFDLINSYKIVVDKKDVFKIEKHLHFLFSEFQILNLDKKKDGYTEFFSMNCFNSVIEELSRLSFFKKINMTKGIKININKKVKCFFREQKKTKEELIKEEEIKFKKLSKKYIRLKNIISKKNYIQMIKDEIIVNIDYLDINIKDIEKIKNESMKIFQKINTKFYPFNFITGVYKQNNILGFYLYLENLRILEGLNDK